MQETVLFTGSKPQPLGVDAFDPNAQVVKTAVVPAATVAVQSKDEQDTQPIEEELSSNIHQSSDQPTEATKVMQPVSLLVFRLILTGIFFYLAMWVLYKSWNGMVAMFPEILPEFAPSPFFSSTIFIWGTVIFLIIALGIYLWWRSIFIMISPSEVVVHGGIIIRQQKVLKRVGISIRSIELHRTFISTILNYVTVEIGSEILGGVSITIPDNKETLTTITTALKPGEVNETKKFF